MLSEQMNEACLEGQRFQNDVANVGRVQRKSNKKDRTEDVAMPEQRLGKTEILDEHDEFEFLGELSRGEMQSCIKNNLYRAPPFCS